MVPAHSGLANLAAVNGPGARQLIAPVGALAGVQVRLFLTSATLLFFELLLIRWIPANVIYVGFFTNFILMASFLGIGLGILLGTRRASFPVSPFTLLLLPFVVLVYIAQVDIRFTPDDRVLFGLELNSSADANVVVLPLVIGFVVAMMAILALPLGGLLRSLPPLRAYAIDIMGSLTGIAGFGLISALSLSPIFWFGAAAVLISLLALGRGISGRDAIPGAAMLVVLLLVGRAELSPNLWSPYYRVTAGDENGVFVRLRPGTSDTAAHIFVNGIQHQSMVAASESVSAPLHGQVYRWLPDRKFDNVLIIGAGTGTDVALALSRGAGHVDAVEIDPVIARIGRDFHPDHPYLDPRVSLYVDDGRAFLRRTDVHYDLIIFALTDSLTLVTSTANVRLESFLYTEEAIESARDHLDGDGVFVMYNLYREPWLVAKLDAMARAAFPEPPILRLRGGADAVIAAGPGIRTAVSSGTIGDEIDAVPTDDGPAPQFATDDWPFLYLRGPGIAAYYAIALAFLLGVALLVVGVGSRIARLPLRTGFSPHFFVLGVAFLLLETRSLVTFSLLFGTTWSVNAMAFFAVLLSVLVAIGLTARFRIRRRAPLYAGLFGTLALAWLIRPEQLLLDPPLLRYGLASALAFGPIVFANLVFASSFRDVRAADMAFASNLLGAMLGGALEYLALITGYQALLLLVAMLYAGAWALASRWHLLADRFLVDGAIADAPVPAGSPELSPT